MVEIHISVSMNGAVESTIWSASDEHGFALHFSLPAVFPASRVHEEFARHLEKAKITWITSRRNFCEVDLDGARQMFSGPFKADWIRGRAQVEPEIIPKPNVGLIGMLPRTEIILRLMREDVVLNQQSRIFLSHKSVDKAMVYRFYNVLLELGFQPWLDNEDIVAGDVLHRELHTGMRASCAAVFFVTPEFTDEKYIKHEIDLAMREQTERGERFRIITLSLTDEKGRSGKVPEILKAYIFKQPAKELEALRDILRGLPIRVGPVEWRV